MTDGHTERREVDGLSCQINEDLIEMEVLILPMVSDPSQNEVRVPASSLSAESHKILKRIAAENELVLLNIGKGKSRCVVVRKKASLQQRQALQMETALKAAEEDRLKREKEERRLQAEIERPTEQPTHITMAIQTTAQEETLGEPPAKGRSGRGKRAQQPPPPAQPPMNAAARRRARRQAAAKAAAAAALRRSRMVETDVQTCPPDHRVCPWCTLDIPPEAQCGHEEVCRAGFKQRERQAKVEAQLAQHRLAVENARRRKRGLAPKKVASGPSTTMTATRARNSSRSPSRNRSRSRTRSVDAHLSAALKRQALLNAQLERVHPNDLDGMVHATHRVCSLVDCPRLLGGAGGSCTYCKLLFCPQHRPPHSGHDCKLAPPPPPEPPGQEAVDGKVSMACGEDYEERRLALRSRLRDKLKTLADKRQR
nr:unnamed protein product [Spirometra erinaceieuropaei]